MEDRIFGYKPVDPNVRPDWSKGYCFTGDVIGMLFHSGQVYIAGQVLYANRVFEDQIYRVYANGKGMVDIEELVSLRNLCIIHVIDLFLISKQFADSEGKKVPQNLRNLFGCPPDYTKS